MIDPGLEGKIVLVTGGAMNIGAAISRAFAAQGARVAVHYVDGDGAAPLEHSRTSRDEVEAFVASLPGAVAVAADFLDEGAAGRLLHQVERELGPVDVLVNNAGHAEEHDQFTTMSQGGVERTLRVNLTAPAMLMAELARRVPHDAPRPRGAWSTSRPMRHEASLARSLTARRRGLWSPSRVGRPWISGPWCA